MLVSLTLRLRCNPRPRREGVSRLNDKSGVLTGEGVDGEGESPKKELRLARVISFVEIGVEGMSTTTMAGISYYVTAKIV